MIRLMPARARAGAAHLTALLQSVFLLGCVQWMVLVFRLMPYPAMMAALWAANPAALHDYLHLPCAC